MKKLPYILCFILVSGLFHPLSAQTLSLKLLPGKAQKALKDFVVIPEGTYVKGLFSGLDSLQCPQPREVMVKSFYLNRYEVSVGEYRAFLWETDELSNHYDSTVWTKDYPYAWNEPMTRNYFWHPLFFQYPIVGITWDQAVAYCSWKTEQLNHLLEKTPYRVSIRLPDEDEWEYAALAHSAVDNSKTAKFFSPKDHRVYPWNGFFLSRVGKGQFQTNCNSGPVRTVDGVPLLEFPSDGFLYTAPVKSFEPNLFGLYQMAGNVAEWTSTDYATIRDHYQQFLDEQEDGKDADPVFLSRINALVPAERYRQYKIIKGGSWVDGAFYMQSGVAKIQDPGRATCITGFRPALVIEKK